MSRISNNIEKWPHFYEKCADVLPKGAFIVKPVILNCFLVEAYDIELFPRRTVSVKYVYVLERSIYV